MQQQKDNIPYRLDHYSSGLMWRDSGAKSGSLRDNRRNKINKDGKGRSIIGIAYQGQNPLGEKRHSILSPEYDMGNDGPIRGNIPTIVSIGNTNH